MAHLRRFETQEAVEKRKARNARIGGLILLVILVLSTIGFAFTFNGSDDLGNGEGNGATQDVSGRTVINYQGQSLTFLKSPADVKDIEVDITLGINDYAGAQVYIDSTNPAIIQEIASTLGRFSLRMQEACYNSCDRDVPEKDCNEKMIIWIDSNTSRVYQNNNCVFIEGNVDAADAFLYKAFGLS